MDRRPGRGGQGLRPRGFPSVNVPGLVDDEGVDPARSASSAAASRTSTPADAPRPAPTMIAIGVASPSAHGQAMMRTPPRR